MDTAEWGSELPNGSTINGRRSTGSASRRVRRPTLEDRRKNKQGPRIESRNLKRGNILNGTRSGYRNRRASSVEHGAARFQRAFTLLELLVVIAIISILAGLLAPAIRAARQHAYLIFCAHNLKQISAAMEMYANDYDDNYPKSQSVGTWGVTNSGWVGWMEQIYPYTKNTNIYSCPGQPIQIKNPFSYFNGCRAIYVDTGAFGSVSRKDILAPDQYILSGDDDFFGLSLDTDKDNYTQDCQFSGSSSNRIAGYHCQRLNILFADGHVKSYNGFDSNEMTYSETKPGVSW